MANDPTATAAFDPESHRNCDPGCIWKDHLSDDQPTTAASINRVDRYTVEVNGLLVRATEDQERQLRAMTPDALERFLRVMGAERDG